MIVAGPIFTLNNGVQMPALGLGTYLSDQTAHAIVLAIQNGYRLFDTASFYANERQVGEGIRQSGIARSELFVTTKLWFTDFGYEPALRAFDKSMKELALDYLDLYLLHWPTPANFEATIASYRAAEKLLAEKRVRAIGVSNFNPAHLQNLMAHTNITPAVNQIEVHPLFNNRIARDENARLGIVSQSWSPLGGIYTNHPSDPNAVTHLLDHPGLLKLAKKHSKTPAQVVLRWHIQHGLSIIPKSANPHRIAQNADLFSFDLDSSDMTTLDGLDAGIRGGGDPDSFAEQFLKTHGK